MLRGGAARAVVRLLVPTTAIAVCAVASAALFLLALPVPALRAGAEGREPGG